MVLSRLRGLYSKVVPRRGRLDLSLHRVVYGRDRLRFGFYQRGPWITSFTVDGRTYGGYVSFDQDARLAQFSARFPPPARVLELGSLEDGQTFRLAAAGYDVLGVEGRVESAERARWLQRELSLKGAEFVVADLEQTALSSFGRFDVVLCCGLLYHLPRPWALIDELPHVAPAVFISTHYTLAPDSTNEGNPGSWYAEGGWEESLSGLSTQSFLLTKQGLLDRVRSAGYEEVEVVHDDVSYKNGPLLTIAARASRSSVGHH